MSSSSSSYSKYDNDNDDDDDDGIPIELRNMFVDRLDFQKATLVQKKTWPFLLKARNAIVVAPTGTNERDAIVFFIFFFVFFFWYLVLRWLQTILAPVWIGIRPPISMLIQFLELPDEKNPQTKASLSFLVKLNSNNLANNNNNNNNNTQEVERR